METRPQSTYDFQAAIYMYRKGVLLLEEHSELGRPAESVLRKVLTVDNSVSLNSIV
jgi:hypothetical protein